MKSRQFKTWFGRWLLVVLCAAGGTWAVAQDGGEAEGETSTRDASPARGSAASWSADLPVVSDGRHVWLWADDIDEKDEDRRLTALYHADATERPPEGPIWETVTDFTGRLAPRGAAADNDTIWLIFDDGKISVISLKPAPIEGDWFFSQQAGKSLPPSTTVRASVAAHGKLWVLARVETGQAIADLDRGEAEAESQVPIETGDAEVLNLVLGLPRGLAINGNDPLDEDAPAESEPADSEADADAQAELPASEKMSDAVEAAPEKTAEAEATDEAAEPEAESESAGIDAAAKQEISEAIEEAQNLPDAPADRLLVLDRGTWRVVPLPEAWESNRPTQLIKPRDADDAPALLVQGAKTNAGLIETLFRPASPAEPIIEEAPEADPPVIRPASPGWSATSLTLPGTGGVRGLNVKQQLVLVQHDPTPAGFAAKLWAVRGDRLTALGNVALDDSTDTPAYGVWAALALGDDVGLLVGERNTADAVLKRSDEKPVVLPAPGPTLTAIDLHGQTTLEPMRMDVDPERPLAESADTLILLGVVIASTLLLFSFWRRDPTANALLLPEGVATADLMRRGLAGVIDLAPGLLVATSAFALPLEELYDRWPGRGIGATWGKMLPGLAAIGIVVGHTLLLEAATGRSLGKWATGLRVTTLTGDRPELWQIVARCLLKTFDLIAYLLLILPIISPYRQRLGDMVARTVVVMKASPAPDDPPSGDTE